jgi:hypothetical protein
MYRSKICHMLTLDERVSILDKDINSFRCQKYLRRTQLKNSKNNADLNDIQLSHNDYYMLLENQVRK